MKVEEINNLIEKLFDLEPIDLSGPTETDSQMRQALAECYSKEGFRRYMDKSINKLTINLATKSDDWEGVIYRRGGIIFLKQLMMFSEKCFKDYSKIKKIIDKK